MILPRALWSHYNLVQDEELPPYDFCYCEVCRGAFKAQEGIDPLDLSDPAANSAWRRFRWDSVTRLVNELADVVHDRGLVISASVFPSPDIARKLVRQDWPALNDENDFQEAVARARAGGAAGIALFGGVRKIP